MPTIHQRTRCEMVGTLSLCPPYDSGVTCFARKRNFTQRPATNWHDEQITIQIVSSPFKNIPLSFSRKSVA